MEIKIRFLGAAQNVTGSRHLLEANGYQILVDCGLFQERAFQERNWAPFVVPPSQINAVFLTHAHLDHCGLLPKLVREGYSGPIYCTKATAEIAKIILLDSARLQEEDAKHKRKRHRREKRKSPRPILPLYTTEDAEACFSLFRPLPYERPLRISDEIEVKLFDAGHVLGSAVIKMTIKNGTESKSVLFSGDIGRPDRPILNNPEIANDADYVLIESTYGDRTHGEVADIKTRIGTVIRSTVERGGTILVPSFALERSQDVLYHVNELIQEKAIPTLPVFLDSPMAVRITKVFKEHPEFFDEEMSEFVRNQTSPFEFEGLELVTTVDQSKAIKEVKGPKIIIAGSGMCTGGRIKHHLLRHISCPDDTVMFVGHQSHGTLGRRMADGEPRVRILGKTCEVKARIEKIDGFSAHADRTELLDWLRGLSRPPRAVFIVHGEAECALAFGDYLREETGWKVFVPDYREAYTLD